MKKKKNDDPKYPLRVTLSTGEEILIPRQSKFDDEWLRKHGCSLIAEFMANQFLGIPKAGKWPIHLLKWHRQHTRSEIFAKVTVRGVAEGINKMANGRGVAEYSEKVDSFRIQNALDLGALVIMERKNPIHTIVLVQDKDGVWMLNAGRAVKTTAAKAAKTATTSKRYRGMVVVRRKP